MPSLPIPISVLLAAVVLTAAWTDARSRSIPNWLTAGGIAAGFAVNITTSGIAGVKSALAGFGVAAGVYALFYILRAVGGGDLKLMAAIGAISGPVHWFSIFLGSALLGGVMAVCVVVWSGRVGRTFEECRADIRGCASFPGSLEAFGRGRCPERKGGATPRTGNRRGDAALPGGYVGEDVI